MERPPLRCLGAFLPLDVLPALLRSLLELLPGVTMLVKEGPPVAGVLGARLEACKHMSPVSRPASAPDVMARCPMPYHSAQQRVWKCMQECLQHSLQQVDKVKDQACWMQARG